ncbi:hypothetical protein GOV05_02995 [Candidatus Woesearchaeota archaeon]|nr:hypothetical protein [Candidatus Woesearchaeota archaeon]
MKRILIAYGTRFNTTAETANLMADHLRKNFDVEVVNLKQKKPDPNDYDAVIVASGVIKDRWTREALYYLDKLEKYKKPYAMFVSSSYTLSKPVHVKQEYLEKIAEKHGLKPILMEAFGPMLDFTKRMFFTKKLQMKLAGKAFERKTGVKIRNDGTNDFRNYANIHDFAKEFEKKIMFT